MNPLLRASFGERLSTLFSPLAVIATLLAAWQAYTTASGVNPVTLPAPTRVLDSGWSARGTLLDHASVTVGEALAGLFASLILSVLLALIIDTFSPLRRALYPLLVGSQTIPIVVIAPLLILWFGFGITPKILVVTLYTFFPITVAFASGLASTDKDSLRLMQTLGARRLQTLLLLKVPHALPYLFTGLRIAVAYAMVGAVFAEWSGAREGLGIYIQLMRNSFRTDLAMAAIFVIAIVSLGLFLLVGLVERFTVRWHGE